MWQRTRHLLRFLSVRPDPSQKSAACFLVARMKASFCRLASRDHARRLCATTAFAPLSQRLSQGFFMPRGFFIGEACAVGLANGIGTRRMLSSHDRLQRIPLNETALLKFAPS